MAVRFNADADIVYGVYNLGGAGHVNFALGGYFYLEEYNDSAGILALSHSSNGRTLNIGCDNNFPTPRVCQGDQLGTTALGTSPPLNTWVYLEISSPNTTGGTVTLRWVELDGSTVTSSTRTNNVESSVQGETIFLNGGGANGFTGGLRAAYVRAYSTPSADDATFLTRAAQSTGSGCYLWWPLADNTDTSDGSGNGRTCTFSGTLTTETSPTLGGGGGATPHGPFGLALHGPLGRVFG